KATELRNWPRRSTFCTDPPAKHAIRQKRRSGYGNRLPNTTAQRCWNWRTSTSRGMESPRAATKPACCWILQHGGACPEPEQDSVTSRHLAANKLFLILLKDPYAHLRLPLFWKAWQTHGGTIA